MADGDEAERNPADHLAAYRFSPGQSGNPGGRPKGRSLTAVLRELLDRSDIDGAPLKGGKRIVDVLGEVMVREALKGDVQFTREIANRVEGKVADRLAGHDGGPLTIRVEYADPDGPPAPPPPRPVDGPPGGEAV